MILSNNIVQSRKEERIMPNIGDNFIPVQSDLFAQIQQHPEMIKNLQNQMIPESVRNTQSLYNNIPKSNPMVERQKETNQYLSEQNAFLQDIQQKLSEANEEINTLRSDLKVEIEQRKLLEDRISKKDWKILLASLCSALFVLAIENWEGIFNVLKYLLKQLK